MTTFTKSQLETIKATVASDTNNAEFNLFMEACKSYGLDPFRKQIFAIVYNKDKPDKRKMTIIVSRDGQRVMASRSGDYRPKTTAADFVIDTDLKSEANPIGLVSASVTLFKQDKNGEWFPVFGEAYWDEFAPVKSHYDYATKTFDDTKKTLDKSGNWAKSPRLMLEKCAESQALRAGWPETFGGVYAEEEIEKTITDASASEQLEQHAEQTRLARVESGRSILFVFDDTGVMQPVLHGEVHGRIEQELATWDLDQLLKFQQRNSHSLNEFWAVAPNDALDIKKKLEAATAKLTAQSERKEAV